MKNFILIFKAVKRQMFSFFILFVILTAVLVLLNYSFSQFLYINKASDMMIGGELKNGLYFINTTPYDEDNLINLEKCVKEIEENQKIEKILLSQLTGTMINDEFYSLQLVDVDIYEQIYSSLAKGQWPENDSTDFTCIIGGVPPKDVTLGKKETLTSSSPTIDFSLEVEIAGVLEYPPLVFNTGYFSSDEKANTAEKFFYHERVIYLPLNETTEKALVDGFNQGVKNPANSGIIFFKDGVSEADKEEITLLVQENASTVSTDIIIQSSKDNVIKTMKTLLPAPAFLFFICCLSFISIAILGVYKNKDRYTIYYLTGCSRRRMVILSVINSATSLVFTSAAVCIAMGILEDKATSGEFMLPNLIFGWQNIVLTISLTAVLLFIVVLITYLMMKKFSPIEHYAALSK